MASASDHRAHAALQPADCLILLPQRLPAAVETSIGPAHYPAECTQSDAFLQPSLRARNGRANSNSFFGNQFYQFKPQSPNFILLLRCRVCGNGVIAKYMCHAANFQQWVSGQNPDEGIHLIETWPKRPPLEAPEHTPDNIRHYYLQGMDNINRKNFDAAGTMFRKSLDSALRRLHP